ESIEPCNTYLAERVAADPSAPHPDGKTDAIYGGPHRRRNHRTRLSDKCSSSEHARSRIRIPHVCSRNVRCRPAAPIAVLLDSSRRSSLIVPTASSGLRYATTSVPTSKSCCRSAVQFVTSAAPAHVASY